MSTFTNGDTTSTIGALTLGATIDFTVTGIIYVLAHRYFNHYSEDRNLLKAIVTALILLNTIGVCCELHYIYFYDIIVFGVFSDINYVPTTFGISVISRTIISVIVQLYYGYRIRRITKSKIFGFLIMAGSIIQCAPLCVYVVLLFIRKQQTVVILMAPGAYISFIMSSLIDLTISATMVYKAIRENVFIPEVNSLVKRIAAISINCNILTSVLGISTLLLATSFPSGWNIVTYCVCCDFYLLSFLAVMNQRPDRLPEPPPRPNSEYDPQTTTSAILFPVEEEPLEVQRTSHIIGLSNMDETSYIRY